MAYEYRLAQLTFRSGEFIHPENLTVFVGPNNSGKSQILKDIVSVTCREHPRPVVLADVVVTLPKTMREAAEAYGISAWSDEAGNGFLRFLNPTLDSQGQYGVGRSGAQWPDGIAAAQPSPKQVAVYIGPQVTAFLTTAHRLRIEPI